MFFFFLCVCVCLFVYSTVYNDLGFTYEVMGRYQDALANQEICRRIYTDRLGTEHPYLVRKMINT